MMIVYHSVWPQAAKGWPPLSSLEVSRPARHRSGVQKGNCEQINESPRRKKNIKKHTKNSWKKKKKNYGKKKIHGKNLCFFFDTSKIHGKKHEESMKIQTTQSLIASVTLRLLEIFEETKNRWQICTNVQCISFQLHYFILPIKRISR